MVKDNQYTDNKELLLIPGAENAKSPYFFIKDILAFYAAPVIK